MNGLAGQSAKTHMFGVERRPSSQVLQLDLTKVVAKSKRRLSAQQEHAEYTAPPWAQGCLETETQGVSLPAGDLPKLLTVRSIGVPTDDLGCDNICETKMSFLPLPSAVKTVNTVQQTLDPRKLWGQVSTVWHLLKQRRPVRSASFVRTTVQCLVTSWDSLQAFPEHPLPEELVHELERLRPSDPFITHQWQAAKQDHCAAHQLHVKASQVRASLHPELVRSKDLNKPDISPSPGWATHPTSPAPTTISPSSSAPLVDSPAHDAPTSTEQERAWFHDFEQDLASQHPTEDRQNARQQQLEASVVRQAEEGLEEEASQPAKHSVSRSNLSQLADAWISKNTLFTSEPPSVQSLMCSPPGTAYTDYAGFLSAMADVLAPVGTFAHAKRAVTTDVLVASESQVHPAALLKSRGAIPSSSVAAALSCRGSVGASRDFSSRPAVLGQTRARAPDQLPPRLSDSLDWYWNPSLSPKSHRGHSPNQYLFVESRFPPPFDSYSSGYGVPRPSQPSPSLWAGSNVAAWLPLTFAPGALYDRTKHGWRSAAILHHKSDSGP
eukprot:gene7580-1355_t